MTSSNLRVLLATLILGSGCSQILGLGDYEIDGDLDHKGSGGDENPGQGGAPGQGGNDSRGGKSQSGDAGMGAREPEGGSAPMPMAGASTGGVGAQGGVGGEAQGGSGSVVIPCDSPECCEDEGGTAVSEEALSDGGFEEGPIVQGGSSPWTYSTNSANLQLIQEAGNGWLPRAGTYFAYLSGIASEESYVYSEDFTVPEDAGWFELSGYRRFQIDTQDEVNDDYSFVAFVGYGASEDNIFLFDWGNPMTSPDDWGATAGWSRFATSWAATPYRGEDRYITLAGVSDDYTLDDTLTASSYLYDDVSVKIFRCYE
ncbi:MAG TPA: hypothetical protein VEX18_04265 [Polyangiaceae bacterium]|nr:hypothetical protein [Polyangiaceae bacterium]